MNNTDNAKRFGFELGSLDAANKPAGKFLATNLTNTKDTIGVTTAIKDRSYISHFKATGNNSWIFKWTAPLVADQGKVSFYYAGNFADSSGTNQGDHIYFGNVTIGTDPAGIVDAISGVSALKVFPAHVSKVVNILMNVEDRARLTVTIFDMEGKVVKELLNEEVESGSFQRGFDVESLCQGMYIVKVQKGEQFLSQRIFKS